MENGDMRIYNQTDREIDLRDMLMYVFHYPLQIFAGAIVGLITGIGYGFVKLNNDKALYKAALEAHNADPSVEMTVSPASYSIATVIAFILIGLCVVVVGICIGYIMKGVVHTAEDVKNYNLFLIGRLAYRERTKADRFAENLLRKKPCDSVKIVQARLLSVCKNIGVKEVTVIGELQTDQVEILMKMNEELQKESIELVFSGSVLEDENTILNLKKETNIIYVPTLNRTMFREMEEVLTFCNKVGTHIVGCIVFD